ncbi:ferrous iron transport protein B [Ruminococcus sp. FC2018]|uniref:ferrous iron transport protein B n=1 Tax=Ruminococcus sp. FC2018 TaxID=1410617 RepID=UPI000490AE84|nr:ferrous iron transport protein B [Ruminococcus sp. FC2018]
MNSIALLGQPNSGKSTVFNHLTGSRQHVGNWPGKTVEKKDGTFTYNNEKYSITDLPGSYGLSGNSDEEVITEKFIKDGSADLVLVLVDASQLERSMFMLAEFAQLDAPAALILNMMDVAKEQGVTIDTELLSERLGIPVLPFTAADDKDYDKLKSLIVSELKDPHKLISVPETGSNDDIKDAVNSKYEWISKQLDGVCETKQKEYKLSKFDKMITSPRKGKIACIGIVLLAFIVSMFAAAPIMGVGAMIPKLLSEPISNGLSSLNVHPWLISVFSLIIPNTLYFCVAMGGFVLAVNIVFGYLEEVGFLARMAYQFDGVLSRLGLQGKAVAPMLMGFGCTIGATSGTRVMDNWGQKMLTMAVVWAVPCASIWSIIPVVSGMFFPAWAMALVILGILVYVFFMMWVVSKIFGKKLAPAETRTGMIMELPPYHKPHWKHIFKEAGFKSLDIFKRALRTVFIISFIFWLLQYTSTGNIEDSLLYKIGTAIEPVTKFFGMGWRTFAGFIGSAFAKESVLGVLNSVFVGEHSMLDATFGAHSGVDSATLAESMKGVISQAEALAFMFAITFNVPCVMALSTTYRESHSLKWTAKVAAFYIVCALLLSCIVYHVASIFL